MSRLLRFAAMAVVLVVIGVAGCKKNAAPEVPQVSGPGVAKPGETLTFGFTSVDPNLDDVWYMVAWGDTSTPVWSSGRPSGEQYVVTHSYPDSGVYFVKARAKDSQDAESPWSDSSQVTVGLFAPQAPLRPTGPSTCTTGVAYTFLARATHPNGDSVAIQFFWGDTLADYGPMVPSGEYYRTTHVFDTLGTYLIAARARDARGRESGWSDSLKVLVGAIHGNPNLEAHDLVLAAATDSTVSITWSAPHDTTPSRYVVSFKETGAASFDSIGGTQALSLVHEPAGKTGTYQVTAVYDSTLYPSTETPATTPVQTGQLWVPELNGIGNTGYGWDRASGEVTLYDMTIPDSADKVDLYVTDFASGFAGPDYWVANPFYAPYDPGGIVPSGNWHIVEFAPVDTLATEDDPLPSYQQSRYRDSRVLSPLPALVACHTEDGYFALLRATDVDTIAGTATIQTWFQLVKNLRLIEH